MKIRINGAVFTTCLACLMAAPLQAAQSNFLDGVKAALGSSADEVGRFFDVEAQRQQGQETAPALSLETSAPSAGQLKTVPSGSPKMTQQALQQMMLDNLDAIEEAFQSGYAPAAWKGQEFHWNLDKQIQEAKKEVQAGNVTVQDYHKILEKFFQSTRDYHETGNLAFAATESASLPLVILSAQGHYFIASIDRNQLPESSFPFHEGDEITQFNGQSIDAVVRQLEAQLGKNEPLTDQAIASLLLTHRSAARGMDVPQGPISLTVVPQGSETPVTAQLKWDYTPELVNQQPFKTMAEGKAILPIPLGRFNDMAWNPGGSFASAGSFSIGSKTSFVPVLGAQTWVSSDASNPFQAYIFKSSVNGKSIGYIRIPSYESMEYDPGMPGDQASAQFAKILQQFAGATDGLVIDQVDNPGGSMTYLYSLASMLTDKPLTPPQHKAAITQNDALQAIQFVSQAGMVKTDADAQSMLGPTMDGYPVTYDMFQNMVGYYQFVADQWNSHHAVTDPAYLYGIRQIIPSSVVQYAKPILLLTNELDFSGGDFFPAIMQDNKRVTIFGARTAGAGGYINTIQFPNQLGVAQFEVTASIAIRANGQPIENLGVQPDIHYVPTADDYRNGFQDYAAAVNQAMANLVGPSGAQVASR